MTIYTKWHDFKCWCGREYRSPEKDCTRVPLFDDCGFHASSEKTNAVPQHPAMDADTATIRVAVRTNREAKR
jgi:hypothetical protein